MSTIVTEDLIEEILIRLPCKSLLKFKAVSKQWLRLISSQRFAFRQYAIANSSDCASFFAVHNFPQKDAPVFITPIHSMSGDLGNIVDSPRIGQPDNRVSPILLPLGFGFYCIFERRTNREFLWNPVTRELTNAIPKSPCKQLGLCFGHTYYFGRMDYEDGKLCYQVGRILLNYASWNRFRFCLSLDLYSSKTKSWKYVPKFLCGNIRNKSSGYSLCVNLNGRTHWLIHPENKDTYIFSFKFKTRTLRKFGLPLASKVDPFYKFCDILTSYDNKFLCHIRTWKNNGEKFVDICVMRVYGDEDSWIKEYTVGPIPMDMDTLGFSSKLKGIFLSSRYPNTQLFFCSCNSSNIERCHEIDEQRNHMLQIVERTESLFSIS